MGLLWIPFLWQGRKKILESTMAESTPPPDPDRPEYRRLRTWNLVVAGGHAIQGALMLVLADAILWPIRRTRYDFDPVAEVIEPITVDWIEVELALLVAAFLFLSATAHLLIGTVLYRRYVSHLARGINPYRWYEYAVSASVMIVVIAMLAGIWDLGTLVALFALVAVMNLMGLVMEQQNQPSEPIDWTAFNIGVLAGTVPWIVIAITLGGSITASGGEVPDFVIFIFVSIFIFFNLFAINMIVQYRETWRWESYLFGERMYILLSLVAKSALAWQVYFGTLTSPI